MTTAARANAVKLIENYCFEKPEDIQLENMLYNEGMYLLEEHLNSCDGRIAFTENTGVITIDKNISDEKQRRFLICHEMGHFFNERTKEIKQRTDNTDVHQNSDINEIRANAFAAELLMHEPWFKEYCKEEKITRELLTGIAENFRVTLSAGAIRYSEIGQIPTAVVFSTRGRIQWSSIHKDFPYQRCTKGAQVEELSYAYCLYEKFEIDKLFKRKQQFYHKKIDYSKLKIKYAKAKEVNLVPAAAWFTGSFDSIFWRFINELNFPMPSYNSVLTLLWESEFH